MRRTATFLQHEEHPDLPAAADVPVPVPVPGFKLSENEVATLTRT